MCEWLCVSGYVWVVVGVVVWEWLWLWEWLLGEIDR